MALMTWEEKTFDTLYALDSFRTYWVENERLIQQAAQEAERKDGPTWVPQTDDDHGEFQMEQQVARHLHDEIMSPTFRYSCVVMLYTIVERELLRLVENLEKQHGTQKLKYKELKGSPFAQVTKFVEVFFNLRLPDCQEYNALRDLQKIRDCIVHCHGELDLLNRDERAYLISLNDCRAGFFAWEGTYIHIEPPCVEQFIKEAWKFFIWVFHELKWKTDDSWKEKKWCSCQSA